MKKNRENTVKYVAWTILIALVVFSVAVPAVAEVKVQIKGHTTVPSAPSATAITADSPGHRK
jgi:hypothetical protein